MNSTLVKKKKIWLILGFVVLFMVLPLVAVIHTYREGSTSSGSTFIIDDGHGNLSNGHPSNGIDLAPGDSVTYEGSTYSRSAYQEPPFVINQDAEMSKIKSDADDILKIVNTVLNLRDEAVIRADRLERRLKNLESACHTMDGIVLSVDSGYQAQKYGGYRCTERGMEVLPPLLESSGLLYTSWTVGMPVCDLPKDVDPELLKRCICTLEGVSCVMPNVESTAPNIESTAPFVSSGNHIRFGSTSEPKKEK